MALFGHVNRNQGLRIFWNDKFALIQSHGPLDLPGSPCTEPKKSWNMHHSASQLHQQNSQPCIGKWIYVNRFECRSQMECPVISRQEQSSNSASIINFRKDMWEQKHKESLSTLVYPTLEKLQSDIETSAQFILLQPLLFLQICRMCSIQSIIYSWWTKTLPKIGKSYKERDISR